MASLLERAQKRGNPVIEGEEAVFVWQGKQPRRLIGDFNHWDHDTPLEMTEAEPGVWTARLPLPQDAYMEYAFFRSPTEEARLRDPLSKRRKPNGMGAYNHWFGMPAWRPAPETRAKRKGARKGLVTKEMFASKYEFMAGGPRAVHLYQPPTGRPVPLLVVWDGPDYLKRGHLVAIVDNLIQQERIQPIAMVMPDDGAKWKARGIEYHTSEATVAFAEGELLPFARQRLNLLDEGKQPGVHGVLGASMGGLMAMTTGWMVPHVFGRVISQSGMFMPWTSHGRPMLFDLIEGMPTAPLRIWQDCGVYDSLLEGNQQLRDLLTAKGYDLTFREYNAGHNYTAWGNSVVAALEVMFAPK
jgi:enterochelin esterase family protein